MSVTVRETLGLVGGLLFLSGICIALPIVLLGYLGSVLAGTGFPIA